MPRSIRPVTTVPRPGDREDVFDRHQERLVDIARRQRHVLVDRIHQRINLLFPLLFAVQRTQCGQPYYRQIVARELIGLQQFAYFELHQVKQLGIIHRIALVQRNHDVRHTYLTGEQHVLTRLRHRTIRRRDHQNRAIHLRRAGDHVLDVVGVTRAVDVRVVPIGRLVLDVCGRDRDTALALFRSVINRIERPELDLRVVLRQYLRDRRRQRRLPVINVSYRPHIHVRLTTIKFLFRHSLCS